VVLCQITSQPYADVSAIAIESKDIENGTLRQTSYVRPAKLFTANQTIIARTIGELQSDKFDEVIDGVISIFKS
jgi:mRNA interferase MazF